MAVPAGVGSPGSLLLVVACIAWSGLCFLAAGTGAPEPAVLVAFGAKGGPAWPFTAHLVHENVVHLTGNAFALWHLAGGVERAGGRRAFLATLLAAAAGGALASAAFGPPGGCGASALVFGFGARGALREGAWPLAMLAALTLAGEPVDGWAHLGGALGGLGAALLDPPPRRLGTSES